MATNYINGIPKNNSAGFSYLGSSKVKLGTYNITKFGTPKQDIMGVNVKLGSLNARRNIGFVSDRAPNVPSGFTVNGAPTYGQGKLNRNTTFPTDYSTGHPLEKFNYFLPLKPTGKKYTDLGK